MSGGMREFQPQEYIEVFRGLKFEHGAACPATAFSDGGRLGKIALCGWALNKETHV